MIVEINLKNLKHKLIISCVVIALFYVIYSTIPANEFGKNGEILSDISKFDYLNLALERHFLFGPAGSIYPNSDRSKFFSICQTFLAWCIFIM